jgi:hypothetical protein
LYPKNEFTPLWGAVKLHLRAECMRLNGGRGLGGGHVPCIAARNFHATRLAQSNDFIRRCPNKMQQLGSFTEKNDAAFFNHEEVELNVYNSVPAAEDIMLSYKHAFL